MESRWWAGSGVGRLVSHSADQGHAEQPRDRIVAKTPGPPSRGHRTPRISSSGAIEVRFGPTKKASHVTRRRCPPADASSTSPSDAAMTGRRSPAADAVPTLPPTVPRFRIWCDPTVRAACTSARSSLGARVDRHHQVGTAGDRARVWMRGLRLERFLETLYEQDLHGLDPTVSRRVAVAKVSPG
jgi:hypothetical protein